MDEIEARSIPEDPTTVYNDWKRLYEKYQRAELFISISANHEDLMTLENTFSELIGAAEASDKETCIEAKSRLTDAFLHLKRLSGFSFYSII